MKIGIDIDDTLNTLSDAWTAWIVEHHDSKFTKEKWSSWDLPAHAKGGERLYDFLTTKGTFTTMGINSHAQEVTKALSEKHELYIISAFGSVHHGLVEKGDWLAKHFPHIPNKNYIFCNHKGLVGVDVLIDDGPHNFNDFNGTSVLMDRPWNLGASADYRVKNWLEIKQLFEQNHWL